MEKINLPFDYVATKVDAESAEKFVRETSCYYDYFIHAGLLDKMAAMNECCALEVAYSDYGGSVFDRALIEFAERKYPNNIVATNNGFGGQTAFVFGDEQTLTEICDGIEEEYIVIREGLIDEATDEVLGNFDCYGIPDTDEAREVLFDFFYDCCDTLPNMMDFCDSHLEEYVAKHLNKNVPG